MRLSDAKQWADEMAFALSDKMFPEGSTMRMHPDVIRDGIRIIRELEADLNKKRENTKRISALYEQSQAENERLIAEIAGMRDKWTPPDEVTQLIVENDALRAKYVDTLTILQSVVFGLAKISAAIKTSIDKLIGEE